MPYYPPSSGGGTVDAVVAGNNIDVDATDPANPVVAVETLNLADISDVTASSSEVNILDGATLTTTELNYVDGVTSAIQTQLNTKVDTANSPNANEFARFTDADTIEGRTVAETKSDLSLVKGDVGLGNVDNTSDATKDAAATTLTNKTISGASNTITNIGTSSISDNAITAAKTEELPKATIRQNIASNATVADSEIKWGWTYVTGDATNLREVIAVSFDVAFDSAPVVFVSSLGYRGGSNPSAIGDLTSVVGALGDQGWLITAYDITTSGFNISINRHTGALGTNTRLGLAWFAIGAKAR